MQCYLKDPNVSCNQLRVCSEMQNGVFESSRMSGKSTNRQRFMSKKETESFNFIRIKGEATGVHVHGVFSLEVPEGAASFYPKSRPHVAVFLSPLAEVLGGYKPPATYSPLELLFYPKIHEFSLVQTLVCLRSQAFWSW